MLEKHDDDLVRVDVALDECAMQDGNIRSIEVFKNVLNRHRTALHGEGLSVLPLTSEKDGMMDCCVLALLSPATRGGILPLIDAVYRWKREMTLDCNVDCVSFQIARSSQRELLKSSPNPVSHSASRNDILTLDTQLSGSPPPSPHRPAKGPCRPLHRLGSPPGRMGSQASNRLARVPRRRSRLENVNFWVVPIAGGMLFFRTALLLAAIQLSSVAARSFGKRLDNQYPSFPNVSSTSTSQTKSISVNDFAVNAGKGPISRSLLPKPPATSTETPGPVLVPTAAPSISTSTSDDGAAQTTTQQGEDSGTSVNFGGTTVDSEGTSSTIPSMPSSATWSTGSEKPFPTSGFAISSNSSSSIWSNATISSRSTGFPSTYASVTSSTSTSSPTSYTSSTGSVTLTVPSSSAYPTWGFNTTTSRTCSSLAPNEPVTVWIINPNTNTVTVTITGNASITSFSTTPEFTPPTYCTDTPTNTAAVSAPVALSSEAAKSTEAGTSDAFAGSTSNGDAVTASSTARGPRATTTVITTSKNPITEYTTEPPLSYPGSIQTDNKQPADSTDGGDWGFLPNPTSYGPTPISVINIGPTGQDTPTGGSTTEGSGSGPGNNAGPQPTTTTIGRVPVVVASTQVIIGSQTIPVPTAGSTPVESPGGSGGSGGGSGSGTGNGNSGSSVTTITEAGQTFTINPSQVIGLGTIISIPTKVAGGIFVAAPEITTIAGVPVQVGESSAVISGTTYSIGAEAPQTTVVVNGQTISIGPGGLGFAQTTVAPLAALPTNVVIVDGQVFSAIGPSVAIIDGSTVTYGSGMPTKTDAFNGDFITLGPSGIVYDGTTLGGAAHTAGTQLGIAGGLSVTEVGSTIAIISGVTFTIGPGATGTTTVINGHTITAGPIGLELQATTLSYPFNPTTQVVTAGGVTLSEIGPSLVVIGGTTFTYGPGATPTTDIYNGQTISIGPGGIGFATTTIIPSSTAATSTPTAAESAKTTGKKNGAGVLRPVRTYEPEFPSLSFMQPEPIETSTRIFNNITPSAPTASSQHGFLDEQLQSAELLRDPRDKEQGESAERRIATNIDASAADADVADVQEQLQKLNVAEGGLDRPKASFQRISEYENALSPSPPRKQSEGPGFKVVKKRGTRLDAPQLDKFPNEVLTHILSHLPAASLSAVSTVSKRFYSLVTTPHAWRIAFSRFFPGQDAIDAPIHTNRRGSDQEAREQLRSEQRVFTRLTALASWRSEYILRTRLLRSLGRGKPAQIAPGHGASSRSNSAANNANAVVTYSSQLFATINHIQAVFNNGKKSPRFIHGTDETGSACTSDPNIGKIDNWGLSDPQALPQFADLFVGDLPYGEGEGPAGLPNSMDLSQPFGMVYGEGFPGGQTYFRSSEEMRGRFISQPNDIIDHECGIPAIPGLTEAMSAVWIAKSSAVPLATDGLIGIMAGSTLGVVTAYSLGADTPHGRRIPKGQVTAKWVLSPGVPIISIQIDESYSLKRKATGRVWAVALNALGEVFYLTETITSPLTDVRVEENNAGRHAWNAGRTAYWNLVEPSRRVARDDPYHEAEVHGSYSPRSSSKSMRLSKAQIVAETLEIEKFLAFHPVHFRKMCEGWDMRRRLEVDFAGDDGNGAGEGIVVIKCGFEKEEAAEIQRFTRWKAEQASREEYPIPKTPPMSPRTISMASLFGGGSVITPPRDPSPERQIGSIFGGSTVISPRRQSPNRSPSVPSTPSLRMISTTLVEEWRTTIFSLKNHHADEITTSGVDLSTYAMLTVDEDPLRTVNGSEFSSPYATPSEASVGGAQTPGHRARFLAVGTNTGVVLMWNMRGPQSTNPALANDLDPLRIIYTDSPQISCLAVSALYLVHGGNDGLVQSWDPLASTPQPIRTLNSRFSSRARRRLIQAEASALGVGINLYAAGAIILDPDPTVLRGMVSLGTHLRYWSYSSSAADQYQSKKRRLRRSNERGSNSGPDRFTTTGRGALMDYIATEQEELKKEKLRRAREEARLRGRFGVGLGGLSDEEALRYAEMVSAETFQKDEERRMSTSVSDAGYLADTGETSQGVWTSSTTVTPEGSVQGRSSTSPKFKTDNEFEHDIEEAIRLSLMDGVDEGGRSPRASGSGEYDIPITYKTKKSRRSASSSPSTSKASKSRRSRGTGSASSSKRKEAVAADDLDYALQLSLAEAKSRGQVEDGDVVDDVYGDEEFPSLDSPKGKGKGRAR
ncbi:hypothetical protein G7Y89_g11404 [Cudoniella acicularis]|uniref:F-box domain-containing protein n=1 Tax=Cudoniella acicularis TaxID=354080 RepID=A0A8H4RC10_9HELO|nr:hypothetical protein G7Y89_g11404 [Cudoniella acicularis]